MVNRLYNFEFKLKAVKKCLLPSFTGQLIRGAILQIIKESDEILSEKLHEGNKIRPYSVSPLRLIDKEISRTKRGEIIIEKDSTLRFRLGILMNELAERIVKITLQKEEMKFYLAEGEFKVINLDVKKKSVKELLLEEIINLNSLSLNFVTPTYFNIAKQEFPLRFPDPRYLYMNLTSLWNTFNKKVLVDQEEFYSWIENHISINAYNLKTKTVQIAKGAPKIGFKGWVKYKLSGDTNYQQWIHSLSKYAEFSNIGANRTAGLGCVQYISK